LVIDGLYRHDLSIPQQMERLIASLAAVPEVWQNVYSDTLDGFYA
jgi:hypothetical protein